MATYSKLSDGTAERHGVRAILTSAGLEKFASLWLKTAAGLLKIYESVRSCYGSGFWRYTKRFIYGDRFRY